MKAPGIEMLNPKNVMVADITSKADDAPGGGGGGWARALFPPYSGIDVDIGI